MPLHRLTTVTLGVADLDGSAAFFRAFGLDEITDPAGSGVRRFATRDGGEQLRLEQAAARGLKRLGVGVHDPDDLARIAARLAAADIAHRLDGDGVNSAGGEGESGRLVVTEPHTGAVVELTVAPALVTTPSVGPTPVNSTSGVERRDVPSAALFRPDGVRPSNLTHLVLGSPDQVATLAFFTDLIGFEISDQLPGIIAFTRCGEVHHNLAIQAAPCPFVHHVAFEVDDVDEVARGGTHMILDDPQRDLWGLGRHAIGSNWFWYLREPSGTYVEYTADVDRITTQDLYRPKEWQGHEFLWAFGQAPPAEFVEPPDLADLVVALTEA